jgi:hypothetical protein
VENFLPLAFAVAVIVAMAYPVPGKAVVSVVVGGPAGHPSCGPAPLPRRAPLPGALHPAGAAGRAPQVLRNVRIIQEINIAIVFFIRWAAAGRRRRRRAVAAAGPPPAPHAPAPLHPGP